MTKPYKKPCIKDECSTHLVLRYLPVKELLELLRLVPQVHHPPPLLADDGEPPLADADHELGPEDGVVASSDDIHLSN